MLISKAKKIFTEQFPEMSILRSYTLEQGNETSDFLNTLSLTPDQLESLPQTESVTENLHPEPKSRISQKTEKRPRLRPSETTRTALIKNMEKNAGPSQADPDMVSSIVGRLQEALNNNDILNAHRIAGQIQAIQRDLLHIEPDETLHRLFNEEEEKYHKFLANEEEIEEKIRPLERLLDIAEKNGEVSEIANKLAKILPLVEKSHKI